MAGRAEPETQGDLLTELAARLKRISGESTGGSAPPYTRAGDAIVLLQPLRLIANDPEAAEAAAWDDAVGALLRLLREKNFLTGEQRVVSGGLAAALLRACVAHRNGFDVSLDEHQGSAARDALFGERPGCALLTCRPSAHLALTNFVDRSGRFTAEAIGRVTTGRLRVRWMERTILETQMSSLLSQLSL